MMYLEWLSDFVIGNHLKPFFFLKIFWRKVGRVVINKFQLIRLFWIGHFAWMVLRGVINL